MYVNMALSCIKYVLVVQWVSAICNEKDCQAFSPKEALLVQKGALLVNGKDRDKRALENKGEATMSMNSSVEQRLSLSGTSEGPLADVVADYVSRAVGKGFEIKLSDVVPEDTQIEVEEAVGKAVGDKIDELIPDNLQVTIANALKPMMNESGLELTEDNVKTINHIVVASTAELSEDGYQKVAALKDDEAMLTFVQRQLDAIGLRARSQTTLKGWVSWFSGIRATQNYATMMNEIRTREWIIPNHS